MKDRFDYIDSLRGFAILGVIAGHAAQIAQLKGSLLSVAILGGYGVQLFFVVSAFTIFLTYERSIQRERSPVRNFFIRRLMRIVPVYWFGILIYVAVYGLESRGWRPGPDLWHFPYHIFLVNLLHPLTQSSVVPGGWSISCEVLFYMTVPLWFFLIRSFRSAVIFAVASIILGPQFVEFIATVMTESFAQYPLSEVHSYWYRSLPNQMGIFAIGILLYHTLKQKAAWVSQFKKPVLNIALLVSAAVLVFLSYTVKFPMIRPHFIIALAFGLITISISQIPWTLLVNSLTIFIGRISYSCYLWHFLVLKQLTLALPPGSLSTHIYFVEIFVLSLIITIPLALISYVLLEKPCVRLGRGWINNLESPSASNSNVTLNRH